jgi:hypothetical protein
MASEPIITGASSDLPSLEDKVGEGKWNHVIEQDVPVPLVTPPHKTRARLRTDSIVRALVTWGKSRTMKNEAGFRCPQRRRGLDRVTMILTVSNQPTPW